MRKDRQPSGEFKALVVRLPQPVYERLRKKAFNERRSMASIIVEALHQGEGE